jgi:hypothetical protein
MFENVPSLSGSPVLMELEYRKRLYSKGTFSPISRRPRRDSTEFCFESMNCGTYCFREALLEAPSNDCLMHMFVGIHIGS